MIKLRHARRIASRRGRRQKNRPSPRSTMKGGRVVNMALTTNFSGIGGAERWEVRGESEWGGNGDDRETSHHKR